MITSADLIQSDAQRTLYANSPFYHALYMRVRAAEDRLADPEPVVISAIVEMATTITRLTALLVDAALNEEARPCRSS